ncbi:c-type cytochrome [Methylomagnum sp.]
MSNTSSKTPSLMILTLILSACSKTATHPPPSGHAHQPDYRQGMYVYNAHCGECHNTGKNNAPSLYDPLEWDTRALGFPGIFENHASKGFLGMPGKGGHDALSEDNIADAVHYMIRQIASEEEDD